MKKLVLIPIAALAIALPACGGTETKTVVEHTTTPATASAAPSAEQQTADWLVKISPSEVAGICNNMHDMSSGREIAQRLGEKFLGTVILRRGADVEQTVSLLLDHC